jgi:WD40 repeat protein
MAARRRVSQDSREDGAGLQRPPVPTGLESPLRPVRAGRAAAALAMMLVLVPGWLQGADDREAPLPPRALARIGTDDLRTRDQIAEIAFSPDGRIIAAAEDAYSSARVSLFDVRTGRQVGRIAPPNEELANAWCVAFSPDGTKLAWGEGEQEGHVALWDLAGHRLLYRARLHDRTVNAVAFSPDGRLVASGGADGAVHVRRVERLAGVAGKSGKRGAPPLLDPADRDFLDRNSQISRLAFTPDGTRLVAGGTLQASIVIWRLSDGELLRRIAGAHGELPPLGVSPSVIAVTPDGRRIMSAAPRTVPIGETRIPYGPATVTISEVRLWDIETGERVGDLHDDEERGFGLAALSRDGRRIALADFGAIRILDAATGRTERRIPVPGCGQNRPAFSPDGTLVAVPVMQGIHIFDVQTGRRLLQDDAMPAGLLRSAAWSPSGDRIATGHFDGIVRVWDAATGKPIWHKALTPVLRATPGISEPRSVAFSGDGRRLIAAGHRYDPIGNQSGIVAIYAADTGAVARAIPGRNVYQAAPTTDGRIIVLNTHEGSNARHLIGIDPETGRERWSTPAEGHRPNFAPVAIGGMQLRSNTSLLEAATSDGNVVRFNALTGREVRRFRIDGRPPEERDAQPGRPALLRAAFSADGRTLASNARDWIYIWDVESGMMRREIRLSHEDGCVLALAPDGRTLAIGTGPFPEDAIRIVDVESGAERIVLHPGDRGPRLLVFSPDGTKLLSGFDRGSGIVWDVRRAEGQAGAR